MGLSLLGGPDSTPAVALAASGLRHIFYAEFCPASADQEANNGFLSQPVDTHTE